MVYEIHYVLSLGAVESVEMKTVLEEPHSTPESNIEKQTKASESDDTYGVGFLSGLASVVQSTVSCVVIIYWLLVLTVLLF